MTTTQGTTPTATTTATTTTTAGTHDWPAPVPVNGARRAGPRRRRVYRAFVAVVAAGVLAAAVGWDRPPNSLGAVIVVLGLLIAVDRAAILPSTSRRLVALAACGFLPWLAVRSSPWLLVPDVIAGSVLVALALSVRNGGGTVDGVGGYVRRLRRLARGAVETPAHIHLGVRTTLPAPRLAALRRTAVPVSVGIAVAALVAAVLASGDALFASYLDLSGLIDATIGRFVAAAGSMVIVSVVTGAALTAERRPPIPARRWVSPRNAVAFAAPLCLVYVAFVAVQTSSVVLGAAYVRERTGLTFAEYARSGFFQLVAVATLTFVGLLVLRPTFEVAGRRRRRVLGALASVGAACTLVMVAAAIVKLQLYADVFGLTMLRLYTQAFAAWLGLAILLGLLALGRRWGDRLVSVVALTALAGVFVMNVVNPERMVVEHNLTDTIDSAEFDAGYLANLSADVVPTLVAHLDDLDAVDREVALRSICRTRSSAGLDWNWSRSRADEAAGRVC